MSSTTKGLYVAVDCDGMIAATGDDREQVRADAAHRVREWYAHPANAHDVADHPEQVEQVIASLQVCYDPDGLRDHLALTGIGYDLAELDDDLEGLGMPTRDDPTTT